MRGPVRMSAAALLIICTAAAVAAAVVGAEADSAEACLLQVQAPAGKHGAEGAQWPPRPEEGAVKLDASHPACRRFDPPDISQLTARKRLGPVVATKAAPDIGHGEHEYLFIISWPYSGSTATLGLVSTSPEISNLCSGGFWACEGQDLLHKAGLLPNVTFKTIMRPELPADWATAVSSAYAKFWNMSKTVLVDKSPPNINKVGRISNDLRRAGKRARFILLTRSPCYHQLKGNPQQMIDAYRAAPAEEMLHVRYEDLVRDPYGEAQRILDFLPSLRSLDPAASGVGKSKTLGDKQRGDSIVEFVLKSAADGQAATQEPLQGWIDPKWLDYARVFGYDASE